MLFSYENYNKVEANLCQFI